MAARRKSESALHLSDDLILEILVKVSYKAIFKCKCICKTWESLISDSYFKKRYLAGSNSISPLFTGVFFVNSKSRFSDFDSIVDETSYYGFDSNHVCADAQMDTSLKFLPQSVIVVASHCGFLLCAVNPKTGQTYQNHDFQYIVCNPLTKQLVSIPNNGYPHHLRDTSLCCYESSGGKFTEFSLVCFVYSDYVYSEGVVFTYSSETRKWKKSKISFAYHVPESNKIVYGESVYFCYGSTDILVYDWKKENACLLDLPMPNDFYSAPKLKCLGDLEGSLYYALKGQTCISVWVLEDDGVTWSFKHNISLCPINMWPLGFHPVSPHLLLLEIVRPSDSVILYDVSTETTEVISTYRLAHDVPVVPYCLSAWSPSQIAMGD